VTSKSRTAPRASAAPVITFLSDFGDRDGFVGIVKGVLLTRCPEARIVDLSHDIPPQDVTCGALVLASGVGHFPPGTVHLAVVDPGVGGERRPIAVVTPDFVLVGPDNGLLSLAVHGRADRRVYHLDRTEHVPPAAGRTFHARDVFGPFAAMIASGTPPDRVGTEVDALETLSLPVPRRVEHVLEAQIIYVDRFGNLVSNVEPTHLADFRGQDLSVSIRGVQIAGISTHYAAVREGRPLVLWNSWGRLEIAVRNDSAARHLRARMGDRITVAVRDRRA